MRHFSFFSYLCPKSISNISKHAYAKNPPPRAIVPETPPKKRKTMPPRRCRPIAPHSLRVRAPEKFRGQGLRNVRRQHPFGGNRGNRSRPFPGRFRLAVARARSPGPRGAGLHPRRRHRRVLDRRPQRRARTRIRPRNRWPKERQTRVGRTEGPLQGSLRRESSKWRRFSPSKRPKSRKCENSRKQKVRRQTFRG
mgnify:CR=1 FL=1